MDRNDDLLKKAFQKLAQEGKPTEQQKDMMLNRILMEYESENVSRIDRFKNWVTQYPWRFAFIASGVQAVVFTLVIGTQYTNLFLGFFGG